MTTTRHDEALYAPVAMSAQEIRAAALAVAGDLTPFPPNIETAVLDRYADATLALAERFESYIGTGRMFPWPPDLDPALVDRTGLCDDCDRPMTGGAAGGDLPPQHWCADHDPTMSPGYVAPEWDADDAATPANVTSIPILASSAFDALRVSGEKATLGALDTFIGHVRSRVGQYPADTPAAEIYRDLFGTPE